MVGSQPMDADVVYLHMLYAEGRAVLLLNL
jgi:hypothetical protein